MTVIDAPPRTGLPGKTTVIVVSAIALAFFAWPVMVGALGIASSWGVALALVGVPLLVVLGTFALDRTIAGANVVALVAVLAALAATARVVSTGVGGFELIFVVVILAGRALGARLGFVVGVLAVAVSSLVWGGFGPWTAFQMFGVGWVAAGAGLLPRLRLHTPRSKNLEVWMLASYGVLASYAFGLLMNLWFWPIAVGEGTTVSFVEGATFLDNATRFLVYSLGSSTLTWDTVRAFTTAVGIGLLGKASLAAIRRVYVRTP